MSRTAIIAVALLITCGLVVAVVRAQDNSGSYPIGDEQSSRRGDAGEQSVLVIRPPIRQIDEAAEFQNSRRSATASRATGLADRLQQVRESASQGRLIPNQRPAAIGATAETPPRAAVESPRLATRPTDLSPTRSQASTTASSRRSAALGGERYSTAPPSELPSREQTPTSIKAPSYGAAEPQPLERQPLERQPLPAASGSNAPHDSTPAADLPQREPISLDRQYDAPADDQIQMTASGPALRIDTAGPRSILIGKQAVYAVTVSNVGRVVAKDVFVRIELPDWVEVVSSQATTGVAQPQEDGGAGQRLIWNVTQLAAEGQETLRLTVTPTKNRSFGLAVDWTVRPESSLAQIDVQEPQLEMSVFGPKDILFGETAVYTIQLTNPGTGDADDVSVDFSYGAQSLPTKQVGTLAAGAQTEISVELTSRQAGTLPVSAVATAASGLRAEATEEVLVRRAHLELAVAGSPRKFAGGVGSYEVHVRNTGNATAANVLAKVVLPTGAKFVSGGDLTPANQGFVKSVGPLAPGAERVFTLQCQLLAPGDNRLEVHAEAESELVASGSFVTRVDALADLKLRVNDPQGPTAVGAKANYEIVIENRGTKAAADVNVVAQFSEGVEPVRAQGAVAEIVPGQVLFQTIPRIGPGEQIKLTIVAVADQAGNHRFRVETTSTDPETRLVAEESTHYFGQELIGPR